MSNKIISHLQSLPYSIYIDKRPLRAAFLVDPNKSFPKQFDEIIEYNQSKWGGRFIPIIFTDGKTIKEKWWDLLRYVDPDFIKSLIPLDDELLKKIDTFLSPLYVEVPHRVAKNDTHYSVRIFNEGLSILPTLENVKKVSQSFMDKSKLVLFELGQTKEDIVKQFIHRNFGIYNHTLHIERALDQNEKKIFQITDRESLATAFKELSTFERFTYPIQICSLPNTFRDIEYYRMGRVFTVVAGDSAEDIAYSWNRALLIPNNKRTHLNQIWLPTELANDLELENALKIWLKRVVDPAGTTTQEIQFVTFSLEKEELEEIASRLTKEIWLRKNVNVFAEMEIPNFQSREPYLRLKENMDLYRATGNEEHIILNEPDVLEECMRGEHWMADVYIKFRPERYTNIVGKDLWWQLPKRNHLANNIFHTPSRIGLNGFPSVLMQRGKPGLEIKLPGDEYIFHALITEKNTPAYSSDPRSKFAQEPFYYVQRSDKGRYLSGFLDIFSDLSYAYQILEEKYWRNMFNILSHQDPSKDEKRRESILNKLNKKMHEYGADFQGKPEGLEWLSDYVLKLSKEQAVTGKELTFKNFIKEAEKELKVFNSQQQDNQKVEFKEDDVKEAISGLTESNILLMGVRSHCPLCGYANWYHINEAQQTLRCKGCGYNYSMRPEEKWYYRLNSLVQIGCAKHGLVPVVLVLGQLLHDCSLSFIYSTSLDLIKDPDYKAYGELDIVCIQDGKFIIGEVKKSIRLFKRSDFEKMAEIAEWIKPDVLIFSSLDPKPNESVIENIEILRKRLLPLEIEVKWYKLHSWIFEASPVF